MYTAAVPGRDPAPPTPVGRAVDARLLAVSGAAFISLTAVFIRLADVTPASAVFYRCLLALPPLAVLAALEWRRTQGVPRRTVLRFVVAGALLGVDFALWSQAILLIGAGISTVLVNVQVVVVPLLSFLIIGTRIPARFVLCVPVLFAGIALAGGFAGGVEAGADLYWGTFLALLSGLAYAGYIFIVGGSGSSRNVAVQVLLSTAAAGFVGSAVGLSWGPIDLTPGWPAFGWLVALALSAQVFGWILLGGSLPRLAPEVGATLLLLQPVLAMVAAVLVVGERPAPLQLLGCVLVVGAAWFVSRAPSVVGTA
ncbi:DMT family transporter [Rhodococcus kronopolitis]|uniref:DMT family transporter n=1 Tax=Rhodococcus kronopolitis TaxID=1460226 RepID=A0ABV9FQ35_9NOCA